MAANKKGKSTKGFGANDPLPQIVTAMKEQLSPKERKAKGKTYPESLTGSEIYAWIRENIEVPKNESEAFGKKLVSSGDLEPLNTDTFKNSKTAFYQFGTPQKENEEEKLEKSEGAFPNIPLHREHSTIITRNQKEKAFSQPETPPSPLENVFFFGMASFLLLLTLCALWDFWSDWNSYAVANERFAALSNP